TTPGITAEREAIARVGGEMKYTTDVKLSTTQIIEYIKDEVDRKEILVVLDRDGTLIEHSGDFFGQQENWKEELQVKMPVVSLVAYLQTKYKVTAIVASNQAGVARGLYGCSRVEEIHRYLDQLLRTQSVIISSWNYCPDVDSVYANVMQGKISFDPAFVKEKTARKPGAGMVEKALHELRRTIADFSQIIVLGDQKEDDGLAVNLKARFIDVKGKSFEEMKKEIT
ncbi:MAG: HAD-IIIA family hydrolase, partial [Nanoarchaeota archaeon]|nr:HAD-IIIA family hydrolase [Nanoarchaeota archaeon]